MAYDVSASAAARPIVGRRDCCHGGRNPLRGDSCRSSEHRCSDSQYWACYRRPMRCRPPKRRPLRLRLQSEPWPTPELTPTRIPAPAPTPHSPGTQTRTPCAPPSSPRIEMPAPTPALRQPSNHPWRRRPDRRRRLHLRTRQETAMDSLRLIAASPLPAIFRKTNGNECDQAGCARPVWLRG